MLKNSYIINYKNKVIEIARLKNPFQIIMHKDKAWPLIPLIAQKILSHRNLAASKFSL
jgi:hypothetical protein